MWIILVSVSVIMLSGTFAPFARDHPDCKMSFGDGIGGREIPMGKKRTPRDCVNRCIYERKTVPGINGVTVSSGGQGSAWYAKCYCEIGMTGQNGNKNYKTCKLAPPDHNNDDFGCVFEQGDGVGGPEISLGKMYIKDCVKTCKEKKEAMPDINGVTIGKGSGEVKCFCERRMTKSNGSPGYKTCKLPEALSEDRKKKLCRNLERKTVAIKAENGLYLIARQRGRVSADSNNLGKWEKFTVELLGGCKVALKSYHKRYLVADRRGNVFANRIRRSIWATFTVEFEDINRVSFKSYFNKYLSASQGGHVDAKSDTKEEVQIFSIIIVV